MARVGKKVPFVGTYWLREPKCFSPYLGKWTPVSPLLLLLAFLVTSLHPLSMELMPSCLNTLTCCSVTRSCPTLWPHALQHTRPPCPSPSATVCPSPYSLHRWWCTAISSSNALFSFCPQSFPASGTFPSHLFTSDEQNTGALAWSLKHHY